MILVKHISKLYFDMSPSVRWPLQNDIVTNLQDET